MEECRRLSVPIIATTIIAGISIIIRRLPLGHRRPATRRCCRHRSLIPMIVELTVVVVMVVVFADVRLHLIIVQIGLAMKQPSVLLAI